MPEARLPAQSIFLIKIFKHHLSLTDYTIHVLQAVIMQGVKKDMLGFGVFCDPDSGKKVQVDRYTLTSASGVEVQVSCRLLCLRVIFSIS